MRVPWWGWLVLFVAAFALMPAVAHSTLRPSRRVRHRALHAARARPQRRRRLGRAARPRLRGVLRHRRLHVRDARAPTSSASTCRRPSSIPFVVIVGATCGFLVGLPSRRLERRLPRDRDALLPGALPHAGDERRPDLRPRPHGRRQRDPQRRSAAPLRPRSRRRSTRAPSPSRYLYVALAVFAVVYVALHFVNHSRTGRAWRSQREDPLAAEAMGMPVNLIKLMAFASAPPSQRSRGTLFASLNASVVPAHVLVPAADHRLHDGHPRRTGQHGRRHRRRGARRACCSSCCATPATRASSSTCSECSRSLFAFGSTRKLALVLDGDRSPSGSPPTAVAGAINDDWISRRHRRAASTACSSHWVIIPTHMVELARPGLVHRPHRASSSRSRSCTAGCATSCSCRRVYLGTFVWENVLLAQPDATRYIVLGVMLIVLMIVRPNGLFGERRVEIV